MKKWYIGALITAFTLLGFISKDQAVLPNQKIVLQFSDTTVSSSEIKYTISIVEKQLLEIGVDNIQIHEIENGQLKITYYSDVDVVIVKDTLSQETQIALGFLSNKEESPKLPSHPETANYNLDVFKIQDASDADSGFAGKLAIEPRLESDRFFNPNVNFLACFSEEKPVYTDIETAYKVSSNIAIAIDTFSYKIPEVRAGPTLNKTS
ncbi:hypothetical protein [Oceanihabitans sediminis]|uniref:Uncharacterized protein n=1 Tax=Oceanihabitans sediminis TaxID=1812012 RepID=A0A368P435_9FLAO|nr:hypothetical protein [Oceanihabitans sediminis]MDX1774331.1 hypothetical protein [Oceanihabitans sediminis]RCU57206.1 hypothetical protein DU428_09695 [Oceanihabitans sediminis]